MRFLTLGEVVVLHRAILVATGGAEGIRDLNALESALAQPKATFDGTDLYPTVVDKASALAFGLAMNHPFVDGNKRIATPRWPCSSISMDSPSRQTSMNRSG
jgi:death-on-curing protein